MPRTRREVWGLGAGWNDTVLWYAKAVAVMQARPITDPTSWRYLGAMHGFDRALWQTFGYLDPGTALPPAGAQARDWLQCQHQSWYFLPWHRGYLAAFEAIVRAAIVSLGGPADWALPYWNYSNAANPNARKPPTAFSAATLPGGAANPLHVTRRYGSGAGHIAIKAADVALTALTDSLFVGGAGGGAPGFGGPRTSFSHDGQVNGGAENLPHNIIHVRTGGVKRGTNPNDPADMGLMTMPETAALDPIFWLHHANIDRLWEVWRRRSPGHVNPVDPAWLTGPADRAFSMPGPNGQDFAFTAADMLDTTAPKLDYVYEDVSDPLGGLHRLAARLQTLNVAPAAAQAIRVAEASMATPPATELMGANAAALRLDGRPTDTVVRLDPGVSARLAGSFQALASGGAEREPDRVFLNLENITGQNDAAVFYVYVGLPVDADPADHPQNMAGVVSLFGVSKASRADDAHAGNGVSTVLEITDIVDRLHLGGAGDLLQLVVRFVPDADVRPRDNISVGRVSVYRQG